MENTTMANVPLDDRFDEMRENEGRDVERGDDMPVLVNALPSERPVGAQRLAVQRKADSEILAKISALAAAAGDAWYYRWPVKSKGKSAGDDESKKWVEGPSIKLANDLARIYGNCDVDVRVVEDAQSWVFYARFIDLETGFSMTRPFQQRKGQQSIRGDYDRARDIAFQIGASKAIRNVVCNALQTYADYGFERARASLVEKIGKNIDGSRKRLAEVLAEHNIEIKRVERSIGRVLGEMLAPDIAKVLAVLKAVDDGMATLNESFPAETVALNGSPLADPTEEPQQAVDPSRVDKTTGAMRGAPSSDHTKEAKTVATEQQPREAPQEARTEAEAQPATQQRATPENAQATAQSAENGHPQDQAGERDEPRMAPATAFLQEAIAVIENAVSESALKEWWKRTRPTRDKAGLSSLQISDLTEAKDDKLAALSTRG
jgi:hypothetical protein